MQADTWAKPFVCIPGLHPCRVRRAKPSAFVPLQIYLVAGTQGVSGGYAARTASFEAVLISAIGRDAGRARFHCSVSQRLCPPPLEPRVGQQELSNQRAGLGVARLRLMQGKEGGDEGWGRPGAEQLAFIVHLLYAL